MFYQLDLLRSSNMWQNRFVAGVSALTLGAKLCAAEPAITNDLSKVEVGRSTLLERRETGPKSSSTPASDVLDQLSARFGLVVIPEVPLDFALKISFPKNATLKESIQLLAEKLAPLGLSLVHNQRALFLVTRAEALTRAIPVQSTREPTEVIPTALLLTEVVPLRSIKASELPAALTPLLPPNSVISPSESGSSIIITASGSEVKRMLSIVQALEQTRSSHLTIHVEQIRFADAKSLAREINDLFGQKSATQSHQEELIGNFSPFPAVESRAGVISASAESGSPSNSSTSVLAVADEQSNALIVRANPEFLPTLQSLLRALDKNMVGVTLLQIFSLRNSEPSEMADCLMALFEKGDNSDDSVQLVRVAGSDNISSTSRRQREAQRVLAVPDTRTSSLIVRASEALMPNIRKVIEELDNSPSRKQRVLVYNLASADPQRIANSLNDLFGTALNNRGFAQEQLSALDRRAQQTFSSVGNFSGFGNQSAQGRNRR